MFNLTKYREMQAERAKLLTTHRISEIMKTTPDKRTHPDQLDLELNLNHLKSILLEK